MDVHPPHGALHSWKDFWIHLGTISIGLLIAIALEQSVEWMHHLHERHRLEADVREELRANVGRDAYTLRQLDELRAYLVELKAAVDAQRAGKVGHPPAARDPRRASAMVAPTMAAWESAKESGTLAFLPSEEIRLYNRFLLQMDLWRVALQDFEQSCVALASFEERFEDQRGLFDLGDKTAAPSLAGMSKEELQEYTVLLASTIKEVDQVDRRLQFVNAEDEALLDGARTEDELVRRTMEHLRIGGPDAPGNDAPEKH